jgi:hypothetical protein
MCAMLRTNGSSTYAKAHTWKKKKKAASQMNTMSCSTINRKTKTCNEIGMLPSVRNVTEVLCFPFGSRNVNVCRVSDSRACNIQLPCEKHGSECCHAVRETSPRRDETSWEGRRKYHINTGASDTNTHVILRVDNTVVQSK